MYAFWKYDLYPYVLGGKVMKEYPDGAVGIESYGGGYRFKPIACLPDASGKPALAELKRLEREYKSAQAALLDDFNAKAQAALPFKIES